MLAAKFSHQPRCRHGKLRIKHLLGSIVLSHPPLISRPAHTLGLWWELPLIRVLISEQGCFLASHTTTEQVGDVAAQAEIGTLVLNHFVPGDDPAITEEVWVASAREAFNGPVIAGRDLLVL